MNFKSFFKIYYNYKFTYPFSSHLARYTNEISSKCNPNIQPKLLSVHYTNCLANTQRVGPSS